MEYIPRENLGEGYGVVFFPILEILGQAQPKDITFPSSHTLESELCAALRAAVPLSTVPAEDFQTVWDGDTCPDVNGSISHQWPNPGKEIKKRSSNNTGNIINFQTS